MSRSYRKQNFYKICGDSGHSEWKRGYNRTFRRNAKINLHKFVKGDCEDYVYRDVKKRKYADIWSSPSDGVCYYEIYTRNEYENLFRNSLRLQNYDEYLENMKKLKRK